MEHTATCASKNRVSRFTVLIADFCNKSANSGCEQSQQGNPLIDHLVGACGEAGRHFEPGMSTGRIWQGRVYSRPRGRDFVVASLIKNHVRRRD